MRRDFVHEMRAFVEEKANASTTPAPLLAKEIVEELRRDDSQLLDGWLRERQVEFVRDLVNFIQRSNRARLRVRGPRDRFNAARNRFEDGDSSALQGWLGNAVYTMKNDHRKQLGALTPDDLDWLISDYQRRERSNAHERVFVELIRAKVPDGVVADHLTNDQIEAIRASIGFD